MHEITDRILAEAAERQHAELAELRSRLDCGEEITLMEAFDLVGWRGGDLSRLLGYVGRGKRGSPLESVFSEISPEAWAHLRWDRSRLDNTVITDDGERSFEVWLRLPDVERALSAPVSDSRCDLPSHREPSGVLVAPEDPVDDVFAEIIRARQAADDPLPVSEYDRFLRRHRLQLSSMGRVIGAKMGPLVTIERVPGHAGSELCRWLMLRQYQLEFERFATFPSGRAVAAELFSWISDEHRNVPGAPAYSNRDPRSRDVFAWLLKRSVPTDRASPDQ